ncbi:MAG: 5-bromo-4-chloroindolyl phosphate hydrolysis family protein, partial [Oscillospiraceae bacterium]|nr:5-bromo-4-chloroindolyl phosphate hydrolysis family protein [Oscillospiraceae bacterium]
NRTSVSRPYPSGYDSEMAKTIRQASSGKTVKVPDPSATTAMIIGGIFFAALFLDNSIDFIRSSGGFGEFLISIALAGAGIALAGYGISRIGKRRLRLYQQVIGQKQVANISDLARAVGKRERFVVRDLKKMIKKGHFPEGHLDDNETMLILTDTAYEQYRTGEANRKLRELKEARIKEDPNGMEAIMAEGEAWILKIRRANDALPGEEISRKLDQLESVTRKIFSTVEKKPEKLSEIRRFMNYYLPTTVKLVTAYQEFEAQPVQGANIQTTKQEILDILDTVNNAFAALLDSLYEHDALDISSDITVLKICWLRKVLPKRTFPDLRTKLI